MSINKIDAIFQVLDQSEKSKLTILDLLKNLNSWIGYKEISNISGFSISKVRKYIMEIQEDMALNQRFDIRIHTKKAKGVRLFIEDNNSFVSYKKQIFRNSWGIKFCMSLLLGNKLEKKNLIANFFLSEATFNRKLKLLRNCFKEFGLEIFLVNGLYQITGNEGTIRLIAIKIFLNVYDIDEWPFEELDETSIYIPFANFVISTGGSLTYIKLRQEMYVIAIQILRSKYSLVLEKSEQLMKYEKMIKFKNESIDNLLPNNERSYFYLRYLSFPRVYKYGLFKRLVDYDVFSQSDLFLATQKSVSILKNILGNLNINELEKLEYLILSVHFQFLLYPNWSNTEFISNFNLTYPILKRTLLCELKKLKMEFPDLIFDDLNELIKSYILIYSQFRNVAHFEQKITLQIDTDLGIMSETLLANMIKDTYKNRYNIEIKTTADRFNNADIVITDVSYFKKENQHIKKNVEIFVLTHRFNIADLDEILKKHVTRALKK